MGLRVEDLSHSFGGDNVLSGVGLAVPPGEVACLLGPSGCGKTTLLRVAAGLERIQAGRVIIGGRTVADASAGIDLAPEKRRVGLMFQDNALFPHLTVFDNVAFGLPRGGVLRDGWLRRATRTGKDKRDARVMAALARVGLGQLAHAFPHTLSGGEQQRCALLRAMAPEPEVLLLDEPFSGLDVTRRAEVREQTLVLLRDAGIATLIVTHDPEEAMFMADRLFILKDGVLLQGGPPAEIYRQPRDAFVASLFGPVNRVKAVVAGGMARTPLGAFPAPALADGAPAQVLVRPEGVVVDGHRNGLSAHVVSARILGRSSHLRLAVADVDDPVDALVPGIFLPPPGQRVAVGIDPAQAFPFPCD